MPATKPTQPNIMMQTRDTTHTFISVNTGDPSMPGHLSALSCHLAETVRLPDSKSLHHYFTPGADKTSHAVSSQMFMCKDSTSIIVISSLPPCMREEH